jgi:hypothetical protein
MTLRIDRLVSDFENVRDAAANAAFFALPRGTAR